MFTRKDYNLASGFTQQQLYDFLKASLLDAGWGAVVDEYNLSSPSTTKVFVLKLPIAAPYADRLFLRVEVAVGLNCTIHLSDGWNSATHVGGKNSYSSGNFGATTSGTPLTLCVVTDPEIGFICTGRQGSGSVQVIGAVKPIFVHPGWAAIDIPKWTLLVGPTTTHMYSGAANNPWNTTAVSAYSATLLDANSITAVDPSNLRQLMSGLPFYTSFGAYLYLPDEIARLPGSNSGSQYLDTYDVGAEKWLQIYVDTFRGTAVRLQ